MYTEQLNYMENSAKSKTCVERSRNDLAGSVETTDFMSVVFNFTLPPPCSFSLRAERAGGIGVSLRSKLMYHGHKVRGV